jgi:hypothetical protein
MKLFAVLAVSLATAVAILASAGGPGDTPAVVPIVVELFTSEGCSDCPPADALLTDLDQKKLVTGAEIIALGEHVNYWDDLGWKDRFSSAAVTYRQQTYGQRFRLQSVYTPQMVVDGRAEFVGNDRSAALRVIAAALRQPKPAVVSLSIGAADQLQVQIANAGRGSQEVLLALTESGLTTSVGTGENRGRQLRHTAVVRSLTKMGKTSDGHFAATSQLHLDPSWRRENLRAVAFVQEPGTGAIIGAASIPLPVK